jgi:hypothetical protein
MKTELSGVYTKMLKIRSIVCVAVTCVALLTWGQGAQAQVNLAGSWQAWTDQDIESRGAGPDLETYMGIPINDAARAAAQAYTPENIADVHRQCSLWPMHYLIFGPFGLDIWPTLRADGSVLAWNIGGAGDRLATTIWMDGRSPPGPQAANSQSGFSTGRWEGDTLVVTTTNIQDGYLYRNGIPNSNQEVFMMFITRHDNWLSITGIVHDPVYLSAPFVVPAFYTARPPSATGTGTSGNLIATCLPAEEADATLNGGVPHFNPVPAEILNYATIKDGVPHEAAMGGEQTMYPEYIKTFKDKYRQPPGYCGSECCMNQDANGNSLAAMNFNVNVLQCKQTLP